MSVPVQCARVGSVAVALGLAFAAPNFVGIAYATPTDDSSSASSQGPSAPSRTGRGNAARMGGGAPTAGLGVGASNMPDDERLADESGFGAEDLVQPTDATFFGGTDAVADGPRSAGQASWGAPSNAQADDASLDHSSAAAPTVVSGRQMTPGATGYGDIGALRTAPVVESALEQTRASLTKLASAAERVAPVNQSAELVGAEPAASAPIPAAAAALASAPVLTRVIDSIATFFGLEGGAASFSDLMGAIVESVRRQFRRALLNTAPTAAPVQYVQTATGSIIGSVGARDAEGDDLTYTLTKAPLFGEVQLSDDGTYVYTPGPDFDALGGTDEFVVSVADSGWHLNLLDPLRPRAATVLVTVAAPSRNDSDSTVVGATRGFNIYNLTSNPLIYTGTTQGAADSGPTLGTVILPGESAHFELTYYFFSPNTVVTNFSTADGVNQFTATLHVNEIMGNIEMHCSASGSNDCYAPMYRSGEDTILLMDPVDTVFDIPADRQQQQAEVLNRVCASGRATCAIALTGRIESTLSDWHQVGMAVTNHTNTTLTTTLTRSDYQETSSNIQLVSRVKATLIGEFGAEFERWTGETITNSHTFTQDVQLSIEPGYTGTVWARQPVTRAYTNMTIRMGNTTWHLENVYFDTPDLTRSGEWDARTTPTPVAIEV